MYSLRQKCKNFLNIINKDYINKIVDRGLVLRSLVIKSIKNTFLIKKYLLVREEIKESYLWQTYTQLPKSSWQYWACLIIFIGLNIFAFFHFLLWGLQTSGFFNLRIYVIGAGIFIFGWVGAIVKYIVKYYIKLSSNLIRWIVSVLCLLIFVMAIGFYLTLSLGKFIWWLTGDLPLYVYYEWLFYKLELSFLEYYIMGLEFFNSFIDFIQQWGLYILIVAVVLFWCVSNYHKPLDPTASEFEVDEHHRSVLLILILSLSGLGLWYVLCSVGIIKPFVIYSYLEKGWKIFLLGIFGMRTTLYHYIYLGFIKFSILFLLTLIILLLLTLIIATITLIERKVLALVQRRVGPNYIGYKGRFQFIADALKLLVKHIVIFSFTNRVMFMILPIIVLILCYLFWVNLVWGPNLALCEIEYNLLFMGILSLLFSLFLFLVGWLSKNKYAILSSNRVIIVTLNLEIFLNFILLFLLVFFESFSFLQITSFQSYGLWGFILLLPLCPILIITFLLETGRIPFDLGEAESELIAGYTTEMGGFFFALFYLGEYFHLFCFAAVYVLCFFGGWYF